MTDWHTTIVAAACSALVAVSGWLAMGVIQGKEERAVIRQKVADHKDLAAHEPAAERLDRIERVLERTSTNHEHLIDLLDRLERRHVEDVERLERQKRKGK